MNKTILEHVSSITDIYFGLLRKRFGVSDVVMDEFMSKERKAELFLLGAVFSTEEINHNLCDIMIYQDRLYILRVQNDWLQLMKGR